MTSLLRTGVLVVGGGLAGCWAALAAARSGVSVILVEKGYVGTSGVTATAGPGHWWVPPDPARRAEAIERKMRAAEGLGEADWMARILDETWRSLPTLAAYYDFPVDEQKTVQYRALRGPEYMRALRRACVDLGVRIVDHAPALELRLDTHGHVAGAAGVLTQCDQEWEIESGAVVLASGGCAFRSHLLGAANNTGDGLLMAAEVGASLSGMEFSAYYTVAPARTTMTRAMSYAFATYTDAAGRILDIPPGPDNSHAIARALMQGRVFCDLSRMPGDIRAMLPHISPNVMLPFTRRGIDPFTERFEIVLRAEGTIRGVGGVRVAGADCRTEIAGLYVAGDVASREAVTGAASGGGAVNSSWALSSGQWAGAAAARFTCRARPGRGTRTGEAGLRPRLRTKQIDAAPLVHAVQAEMLPAERQLFRTGSALEGARERLAMLWALARDGLGHGICARDRLHDREAAAMIAAARACTEAALMRRESRGVHRRIDYPGHERGFDTRIVVDGLDHLTTRLDTHPSPSINAVPA